MTERLPLLSAQLAFGVEAERSGRRAVVTVRLRTPPSSLSTADVRQIVQSVLLRNPALSYRIRFSRGEAYQEWYPGDCDFAELHAASEDAVPERVLDVRDDFESSLDGAAMCARLIRSPEGDELLLVFDHALVDEHSLSLIKRQLSRPSDPDGGERARYRDAIEDRRSFETAAANGRGGEFWADRLGAGGGEFPVNRKAGRATPFTTLADVAVPSSFRGSLFPYVLFSLHRALRDVGETGRTVIGYPWGGRNGTYSDVVGCFMNTVVSLDTSGPRQVPDAVNDFLAKWYDEIDHADVPFTAVNALGSSFPGTVSAYLSYTHAAEHAVRIAGVPAVQVPSTHSRIPQTCTFLAGATVRGDGVQLRLVLDEEITGYSAREFGPRWRHWLAAAIASASEPGPRNPAWT